MLLFFKENLATVIVVLVIAALIFFSVLKLIKDKKSGKSCCGSCQGCAMKEKCHGKKSN